MNWRFVIAGLAGLVACRFGGPSADPGAYVAFPDTRDSGAEREASPVLSGDDTALSSLSSGDDGSSAAGGDANSGDANIDDAVGTDSSGDDATAGDVSTGDATSDATEGAACSAAVAVCDPVHNTGCNSLQQCDVDPSQTTSPTGLCVFASPAEGGACLFTIVTESCPPGFTCVGTDCKQLCFCDTDCPTGQCCSDTSGPPGFTLCRPCP